MPLSKWRDGEDPLDKDGHYKKNGEYAKALLNSPIDPDSHTIEKEHQHKSRENFKSLYGSYADFHGNELQIDAKDLLGAVVKHINKDLIDAFYKTSKSKFIVVLKKKEHKEKNFSHEKNFKERIHNNDTIFRILPRLPKPKNRDDSERYLGSVFVTMFLPTTISDVAVETAFMNFGKVHYVCAGTYRNGFWDIKNGKRHVRITPFSDKSGLPHQIIFEEIPRNFIVLWPEKEIECKLCGNVHVLCVDCQGKKKANNTHPPNGDGSVTVSRKDEVNRVDGEFMEPDGNVPGSMDPQTQPLTHPTTDTHEDISKNNVVTKTVGPGYPEVIRGTPQTESSSNDSGNSRTHNKDAKIDQVASQTEKSDQENGPETAVPESWEELQNEVPPVTGPDGNEMHKKLGQMAWEETPNKDTSTPEKSVTVSKGETNCPGSSRPAEGTPAVSTNNAETSEGHTGGLHHASTADPPTQESTHVSCPNPDPDKALEATAKTVDTKTQFRKEDVGPS